MSLFLESMLELSLVISFFSLFLFYFSSSVRADEESFKIKS